LIIIRHLNGLETWYAHLSRNNVKEGDYVKAGQVIGFSGNTGRSRGPHLHFEMRYCDQTFDPEFLIDFENGQLKYQTFILEKKFFNIYSRASELLEEEEDLNFPLLSDDSAPVKAENAERESREIWHIVKSGDMLGKLARRYGVTVNQICRLNKIKSTTTLKLGRRLRIK
jgi:LysM repeat protein